MRGDHLAFPTRVLDKLGRRGISTAQVLQVANNRPVLARNPHGRRPGSRLMIGFDDGGRALTIVIEPVSDESWRVLTGWPATPPQIALHQGARK